MLRDEVNILWLLLLTCSSIQIEAVEDIKKQDWEVRFGADKIDGQIMIIYIDIFGNEKREVLNSGKFKEINRL